jgi:SAM-dependent methyltransferase
MGSDPYAHLKDRAWREIEAIDTALERGEIDEAGWHTAMAELIVPAYLRADTPWGGSGKSGSVDDWEFARSLIADALDRPGTFLDVGCANGFLMESIAQWTTYRVEPYGVDISPELIDLARRRLPDWSDRLWIGNALMWEPPRRFTYIRTGLDYVPGTRRHEFLAHLAGWCDRLIIGVFNEQVQEHATQELVRSWGFPISGRTERPHREPMMAYRCFWIDPSSPTVTH